METTQATNDQAAETKEQTEGHFRTWCAAVEMACTVLGPGAIGLIAGQARKNFGMTVLFQRDPAPKVDFLIKGDLRFQYEGAVAEEFLSTLDNVQAKLARAAGHSYTKEDIALATVIRAIADGSINGEGSDVQGS